MFYIAQMLVHRNLFLSKRETTTRDELSKKFGFDFHQWFMEIDHRQDQHQIPVLVLKSEIRRFSAIPRRTRNLFSQFFPASHSCNVFQALTPTRALPAWVRRNNAEGCSTSLRMLKCQAAFCHDSLLSENLQLGQALARVWIKSNRVQSDRMS